MINAVQKGMIYEVRFPYDVDLISIVKSIPGRMWEPDKKCWTIPLARLGFLIAGLRGTKYEKELIIQSAEKLDVDEKLDDTSYVPDIDISDASIYVENGSKLFNHQIDSIKYDKYRWTHGLRNGFLLADQPGLGKTLSVLNIAMYHREHFGSKHCLIITCVNSAKYNWVHDIEKHSNGTITPYILGSRRKRDGSIRYEGSGKEKTLDLMTLKVFGDENGSDLPYFLVLNIEAIGRTKIGKTHVITDRIIELIRLGYFGVIALDEIHKNCSMLSDQGKEVMKIKKKTLDCEVDWIPMTGTPIKSKPTDAFLPLYLVGGHTYTSYYNWCDMFCIKGNFKEIIGYKNIDMLKNMLQPNMLRRLKEKVLDLPPKLYKTVFVTNSKYQESLYEKVRLNLLAHKGEMIQRNNAAVEFLKLRQVNGSPELIDEELEVNDSYLSVNSKAAELMRLLDEILEDPNEKVVIFSNWVEPLRTLYRFISTKYKTCCYTGTMKSEDREKHKSVFVNNPEYRVMIGTAGALGTSHTLTVAQNIIFYDEPWNPSDREQCEDRCHRTGTTGTVHVYTMITVNTVDETVHNIVYKKSGTADFIVDNKLDLQKHPELMDMLLKSSK